MNRPRTKAQIAATRRNWRVRSLRALHAQCGMLDPDLVSKAQALVDEQLVRMQAQRTATHKAIERAKADRKARLAAGREMPF